MLDYPGGAESALEAGRKSSAVHVSSSPSQHRQGHAGRSWGLVRAAVVVAAAARCSRSWSPAPRSRRGHSDQGLRWAGEEARDIQIKTISTTAARSVTASRTEALAGAARSVGTDGHRQLVGTAQRLGRVRIARHQGRAQTLTPSLSSHAAQEPLGDSGRLATISRSVGGNPDHQA